MDSEKKLEILWAKEEIRTKLTTYTRACDRNDIELGASVFKEDSNYDCGKQFNGTGRGFFEWCIPQHQAHFVSTSHRISNILIQVDGDKAYSETYVFMAGKIVLPDGSALSNESRGRYLDQWECIDGEWLIAKRKYILDMGDLKTLANHTGPEGTADKNDYSYQILHL